MELPGSRYPARVVSATPEADGLVDLRLDVGGTPVAGSHERPGQYVLLTSGAHPPAPFAIASAPGGTVLELLIKTGGPLADELSRLHTGELVTISKAQGPGFPLERARGRNLLLFATGSGISAIRSTLLAVRAHRDDYREVTLLFGARTPAAFAYLSEHSEWEADRIRIIRTVSRPGESGWNGLRGYVQQHLGELGQRGDVAFLCGQPAMVEHVTRALVERGVSSADVFVNY